MAKIKRKPRSPGKPRRKPTGYTLSVSNRDCVGYTVTLNGLTGGNGKPRVTRCGSARSLKACLTRTRNKYGPEKVLYVVLSGPAEAGVMEALSDVARTAVDKSGRPKSVSSQ